MSDASSAQLPVTANYINPETMHHPAGYTHVVEVTAGRPVYISGQVALDSAGALVGPGDIRAQARQVFDNLQAALQAVGAGFEQVVKLTYYLVDATQLPVVREVRDQYVNTGQPPANTAVEVRRLVRDDLLIEVEAVAVVASFPPMTASASAAELEQTVDIRRDGWGTLLAWAADRNQSASGASRPSRSRPSVATRPAGCADGWWPRSPSGPPASCRAG